MADSVNMSLDELIQQNRNNRGGGNVRGRGSGRGRGRGVRGRGRVNSRSGTPGPRQGRSRSRNNGPGLRSQSRGRSQSRARSQSRSRSQSRARSRSRVQHAGSRSRSASQGRQVRGLTPKGRAGLEERNNMPPLVRNARGGRLRRSNSNSNLRGNIHNRLGITTRRGAANGNRPLALIKRGIAKRGRGFNTGNRFSNVGLRSDQIIKEQRQNMHKQNNIIRSQTFTRSRNNSFSASQLTVSVANDIAKKRRNSFGNSGYLNKQSLANLTNQFGGYNTRRGPGSVKSLGSNRSNRSGRSNRSINSQRSRGRGRGGYRGVGRKFVSKQILNPKLQQEIAAIQGKAHGSAPDVEAPSGINFTPTPAATGLTLHQRFAS